MDKIDDLKKRIAACRICEEEIGFAPRPVVQINEKARILIVGQAPGRAVHETGIPFNDPSGDRLRQWLGVTREQFYDEELFAIVPMGFCFPGTGKSGDLPPCKACAPTWRQEVLDSLPNIELTLCIGIYAQKWHLGKEMQKNLTETVANWQSYLPDLIPLVHPSPRNIYWLRKHPWFEEEVVPYIQTRVKELLD